MTHHIWLKMSCLENTLNHAYKLHFSHSASTGCHRESWLFCFLVSWVLPWALWLARKCHVHEVCRLLAMSSSSSPSWEFEFVCSVATILSDTLSAGACIWILFNLRNSCSTPQEPTVATTVVASFRGGPPHFHGLFDLQPPSHLPARVASRARHMGLRSMWLPVDQREVDHTLVRTPHGVKFPRDFF